MKRVEFSLKRVLALKSHKCRRKNLLILHLFQFVKLGNLSFKCFTFASIDLNFEFGIFNCKVFAQLIRGIKFALQRFEFLNLFLRCQKFIGFLSKLCFKFLVLRIELLASLCKLVLHFLFLLLFLIKLLSQAVDFNTHVFYLLIMLSIFKQDWFRCCSFRFKLALSL